RTRPSPNPFARAQCRSPAPSASTPAARCSPRPSRTDMSKSTFFRVSTLVALGLAASGCGVFKKGKGPSTPVLGERVAVLTGEGDVAVDPALAAQPMSLPQPTANTEWSQSGGNATKSMGQLALGGTLTRAFSIQAGRGSSLTARLGAAPIVAGGRVYTIDTLGTVRAFDAQSGAAV